MRAYLDLLKDIMENGTDKGDRTGTGTRSVFGRQLRFDLAQGFPLLTTKKVFLRGIVVELLWFLRGDTNIKYLVDRDVHIWDEWPYKEYRLALEKTGEAPLPIKDFIARIKADADFAATWGDIGPAYGFQWRNFNGEGIDQIADVLSTLKRNPDSRRMLVVAYNPAQARKMLLPPCHSLFQFYVADGKLSCQLYQRSCDVFLGVPFNIASYALLTMMMAQCAGLKPGEFVHTYGDVHVYNNHFDQVREQLSREPKPLPTLALNPAKTDIFAFEPEDFTLSGYDPHPAIKAPVAV